jgi:hypothetical protein
MLNLRGLQILSSADFSDSLVHHVEQCHRKKFLRFQRLLMLAPRTAVRLHWTAGNPYPGVNRDALLSTKLLDALHQWWRCMRPQGG